MDMVNVDEDSDGQLFSGLKRKIKKTTALM